jgi:hypothetical protein
MESFIDRAEEILKHEPQSVTKADFELVLDLIANRLQRLHAKSRVDLTNIESVFSLVEMGRLLRSFPETSGYDKIEQAASAIRRVLAETIQHYCRFQWLDGQWKPPEPYDALVKANVKQGNIAAFITFNYDIAIDFALHWNRHSIDYGLGRGGVVPLLKLHGSLGWTTCSCGEVIPLTMDQVFQELLVRQNGKYAIPGLQRLSGIDPHCAHGKISGEPAIVPPSWNKTQYHAQFSSIWGRAAKELAEAEEITVIGYSLPDSDSFFRDLIALGMYGSVRLRRFRVVNSDTNVEAKFRALLGPECERRFQFDHVTFEKMFEPKLQVRAL